MSRIEEVINEMEEYLEDCKFQPLSNSKLVINKDEMLAFIDELRAATPDEIRRYQKIISNKDAILEDARTKADEMLAQTQIRANEMISEHEIMQQAYTQANEVVDIAANQAQEILNKAAEDADNIRTAAIEYTDNLLLHLQDVLTTGLAESQAHYQGLNASLSECLRLIEANRSELSAAEEEPPAGEEGISVMNVAPQEEE